MNNLSDEFVKAMNAHFEAMPQMGRAIYDQLMDEFYGSSEENQS